MMLTAPLENARRSAVVFAADSGSPHDVVTCTGGFTVVASFIAEMLYPGRTVLRVEPTEAQSC